MKQRITILTLGVNDIQISRKFYENLGWKVATEENADNIIGFNLVGMALVFFPKKKLEDDITAALNSSGLSPFTLAYNTDTKEEVDSILEKVQLFGAKIIKPAQEVFWGGYSGYFSDPDDTLWEVAFNPYSLPKEDGSFEWK